MVAQSNNFVQHPSQQGSVQALGASSILLQATADAGDTTDYLLVAPPAASLNGVVARLIDPAFGAVHIRANAALLAQECKLVFKAEGTKECVLAQNAGLSAGAFANLQPNGAFLMAPTDRGLFLRLASAGLALDVNAFASPLDIRGPVRASLDVTSLSPAEAQEILSNDEVNTVLLPQSNTAGFSLLNAAVLNFDASHPTILHLYASDGTTTLALTAAAGLTVSAGLSLGLGWLPALPEGWTLSAVRDVADTATVAPRIIVGYTPTNLAPVRTDQGGAY